MNKSQKVYNLVSCIPAGKITTYKILAEKLKIKNPRLIGKILNQNKNLMHIRPSGSCEISSARGGRNNKIPCHRVVKTNGEIGGYKLGVNKKIELLRKEGILIKNNKIINFQNLLEKF